MYFKIDNLVEEGQTWYVIVKLYKFIFQLVKMKIFLSFVNYFELHSIVKRSIIYTIIPPTTYGKNIEYVTWC